MMVDDLRRGEKGAVGGELLIGSSIPSELYITTKINLLIPSRKLVNPGKEETSKISASVTYLINNMRHDSIDSKVLSSFLLSNKFALRAVKSVVLVIKKRPHVTCI
jgi:hypothetical protein